MLATIDTPIRFPHEAAPAPGEMTELAPGIFWARMPMPLRLDHVNVYLIEDDDGFLVVDAGMNTQITRDAWTALIDGPLTRKPINRILITHFHPDHVGAAGWLSEKTGAPLLMSEIEYLMTLLRLARIYEGTRASDFDFFAARGLDADNINGFLDRGPEYLLTVSAMPASFVRLHLGQVLTIGGRNFEIMTGGGHSDEQIMLYCAAENIFIAADQVMTGITPNIGVWAMEPDSTALDQFLDSLRDIKSTIPADALVLAGHKLPFYGLHTRIDELSLHHAKVCDQIARVCALAPLTVAEIIPKIFERKMNPHHTGLAFAETLAHVNYLLGRGTLQRQLAADGLQRLVAA